MPRITHLLDTSALLAHYFDEAGAAEVNAIWADSDNKPGICALTIPELKTRLQAEVDDAVEVDRVFELYVNQLTSCVAVDRTVASEAVRLRALSCARLPLVDACIAACAVRYGCRLVHRDPHFDDLPATAVGQLRLPDKL